MCHPEDCRDLRCSTGRDRSCLLHGIPVGIRLAVNRIAGRGNVCLVEWNGNHLVAPDIANVADVHGHIVAWLPLDVEGVIDAVGSLFARLYVAKEKSGAPLAMSAVLGRYLLMSAGLPLGWFPGWCPRDWKA